VLAVVGGRVCENGHGHPIPKRINPSLDSALVVRAAWRPPRCPKLIVHVKFGPTELEAFAQLGAVRVRLHKETAEILNQPR